MRIKYFGANEETPHRVAWIQFNENEWDCYEYIANYEKTYGDTFRDFGCVEDYDFDERKNLKIYEAYIPVENFEDFNDFKNNYKEAKKEFNALKKGKKQATEEPETTEEKVVEEENTLAKAREELAEIERIYDTEPYTEEPETATEPEGTKKTDEFKVDKVVFLQKEKRIRVYKDNGIFDFDNFDDMAIELYMACLDALRAGKYEATETKAEPETATEEPKEEDTADQSEEKRVCPICGRTYTEIPAISREDNTTEICPDCGTNQAIEIFSKIFAKYTDKQEEQETEEKT